MLGLWGSGRVRRLMFAGVVVLLVTSPFWVRFLRAPSFRVSNVRLEEVTIPDAPEWGQGLVLFTVENPGRPALAACAAILRDRNGADLRDEPDDILVRVFGREDLTIQARFPGGIGSPVSARVECGPPVYD